MEHAVYGRMNHSGHSLNSQIWHEIDMSNPMPLAHSSSSVIPGSNNDQRYGTTY